MSLGRFGGADGAYMAAVSPTDLRILPRELPLLLPDVKPAGREAGGVMDAGTTWRITELFARFTSSVTTQPMKPNDSQAITATRP